MPETLKRDGPGLEEICLSLNTYISSYLPVVGPFQNNLKFPFLSFRFSFQRFISIPYLSLAHFSSQSNSLG